jgi:hypothetical protein
VAGRQGARREGLGGMRQALGVSYVVVVLVSVGLLSIIAWDALRNPSRDHALALSPSPTPAGPQISQTRQSATAPNTPSEDRTAAFGTKAGQPATPTHPVAIAGSPPAVAPPTPQVQPIAQWPFATVTTTFTRLGRVTSAVPRNDGSQSQNCLALWDPETHMTKEEWKVACIRAPRTP